MARKTRVADQLDLFGQSLPDFKPKGKVRLIELFAGIGAQSKALENLGVDFVSQRVCEWSWQSIIGYNAIHVKDFSDHSEGMSVDDLVGATEGVSNDYNVPMTEEQRRRKGEAWLRKVYSSMVAIGDTIPSVTMLKGSDLGIERERERIDTYAMTYSFPCFTADQLVLTKESGYVRFDCLKIGMHVLSRDGKWHEIDRFFNQGKKDTMFVEAQGFASIHTTPNHRFWVRKKIGKGLFSKPEWVEAKDLVNDCYLGLPTISEEVPFATDDTHFWELVGMYLGDGWLSKSNFDVRIACNERKAERASSLLSELGIAHTINQTSRHCWNVRFHNKDMHSFLSREIGTGSREKKVPSEIIFLPRKELMAFYEGCLETDGCIIGDRRQFATTSKNVAYSMALIINKLFHKVCCVYEIKASPTKAIEGRTVRQCNWYQLRFKEGNGNKNRSFYDKGYLWYPFKRIRQGKVESVYDIEVRDDHSFTLQGCLVSNCQDLSNAGTMKGMERGSGTRSGLLWEVERILLELTEEGRRPDILLMENVPGVCGSKNIKPWNEWLKALEGMGYTNHWKVLNAKDFGIPQNRERCFMVSLLGNYGFTFPKPLRLRYRLRDFLDANADERYYLSNRLVENFILKYMDRLSTDGMQTIDTYNESVSQTDPTTSKTIQTRPQAPNHGELISEPFIVAQRGRNPDNPTSRKSGLPTEQMLEAKTDGTSNTLRTVEKDNYVCLPQGLPIPSANSKGYEMAGEGDGCLPTWKGARGTVQKGMSPTLLTDGNTVGVVTIEKVGSLNEDGFKRANEVIGGGGCAQRFVQGTEKTH